MLTWRSRKTYILTTGLALNLLLLLLWSKVSYAGLRNHSLRASDLPEGSQVITDEIVEKDDISHPLSPASRSLDGSTILEEKSHLYQYQSAYSFSAFMPDEAVFVANFTYRYNSPTAASEAADAMIEDLQSSAANAQELSADSNVDKEEGRLQGRSFSLTGDEEDSIYWFVGVQGNMLSLLMANGFNGDAVESVFQTAVHNLLNRQSQ